MRRCVEILLLLGYNPLSEMPALPGPFMASPFDSKDRLDRSTVLRVTV
jgi:hypothetical protein